MAIKSISGKKFLIVTAAAVLGFGVAASFIVPSANASQNAPTSVVTVTPTAPKAPSAEVPNTEGSSPEVAGIDCNNGLDASGVQCDSGPAANLNDNSVDAQDGTETQSETSTGVDGDNVQSQN